MSLKKSHKSYPQVFKDEAVLMITEQGYSVAEAAKSLGVASGNTEGQVLSLAKTKHRSQV